MTKRMGLHVHTGGKNDAVRRYIADVRPSAMKWLDGAVDPGIVDQARAAGAITIFRLYVDRQPLGPEGGRYIERVAEAMRRYPAMMVAEGYNEQWQSGTELARRADFDIELMRAMDAIGRKAAIGSFSTGQPQVEDWRHYMPALRYAADHGHYVAVHEYGGGPGGMLWGVGRNQWNNGAPVLDDPCNDSGTYYLGWWCLRYRRAVAEWRRLGLTTIPRILITEGGIDDIQPRPGPQGKGWRDFKGQHPASVGDYAAQWAWYCRQLSRDPYVIGAVDFGWATADPNWNSFDLSQEPAMLDRLIQEMRAMPDVAPVPNPAPSPTGVIYANAKSFSPRGGVRPRYIVVHSTDSPAGSTPASTARFLQENDRQVSVHELVIPGAVYVMVADGMAAHHAGNATLPDGTTGSAVNAASWGIEVYQVHGQPCDPSLEDVCVARVVAACRRLDIPSRNVLGHREIDPGRRGDPVGVDMAAFRAAVAAKLGESGQPAPAPAPGPDVAVLIAAAKAEHMRAGVRLNPGSAIQRTMLADGVWPTTNEAVAGGVTFARGESAAAGAWVYWWHEGRVKKAKMA